MTESRRVVLSMRKVSADFTIHQLTIFRTVANQLSYTRTAELLYLSQPTVTQQIRNLERSVGLQLFTRSGRGIVLTPAGKELLQHVKQILALFDETGTVVNEIATLERGSVVVGASTSAGTYVVPPLLGHFHTRHPKVHVTLIVGNRLAIEDRLLSHQIDLAVISIVEHHKLFQIEFLQAYDLVVVAAPDHLLARRQPLTTDDLRDELFLLREHGAGTRLETDLHFAQEHIPLQHSLELGSIEAIKEGVIAGLGIAVLPRKAIELEVRSGDLVIFNVQGFPLQREWHIVTLKNRTISRAAAALMRFLLHGDAGTPIQNTDA